jgi:hypothetical protein
MGILKLQFSLVMLAKMIISQSGDLSIKDDETPLQAE